MATKSERDSMRMDDQEIAAMLEIGMRAHFTTNGCDGWPHVVPLSYIMRDGDITFWTESASRKVRNLRADDRMTCLIEKGSNIQTVRAVQLFGRAEIIEDYHQSIEVGTLLLARYSEESLRPLFEGYASLLAHERVIVRLHAERVVSWDHRKVNINLGALGS